MQIFSLINQEINQGSADQGLEINLLLNKKSLYSLS